MQTIQMHDFTQFNKLITTNNDWNDKKNHQSYILIFWIKNNSKINTINNVFKVDMNKLQKISTNLTPGVWDLLSSKQYQGKQMLKFPIIKTHINKLSSFKLNKIIWLLRMYSLVMKKLYCIVYHELIENMVPYNTTYILNSSLDTQNSVQCIWMICNCFGIPNNVILFNTLFKHDQFTQ